MSKTRIVIFTVIAIGITPVRADIACVNAGEDSAGNTCGLDIASMIQPVTPAGGFRLDDYSCWGPNIIKGEDDKYYLIYSRWAKKGGNWLSSSEIALAVSETLEGPYQHLKVLLRGRGPGHWDELMAHNPRLKRFGDKYYLYYISSRNGPSRGHIRDSQRIGVAVSDSILGPYSPSEAPIVEPAEPVYTITVNPDVTQMADGTYLMILKGDIKPRKPADPMPQRVQGLAISKSPTGPFQMLKETAIHDMDTEDASIWYDQKRERYFAVFHAHEYIGLIESRDGFKWQRAAHYKITGNEIRRADGSMLKTKKPLQRPSIFIENGEPRALCLAVPAPDDWHCVVVPLLAAEPHPGTISY
jgi:beta-xylosidase